MVMSVYCNCMISVELWMLFLHINLFIIFCQLYYAVVAMLILKTLHGLALCFSCHI